MSRHVCIDARMIQSSGIGTYLRGLLTQLATDVRRDLQLTLLGRPPDLPQGPWEVIDVSTPLYSLQEQWIIPRAFARSGASLFHSPHYNVPLRLAGSSVVTIHDLIHLKYKEHLSMLASEYAHFYFHRVIPRVQRILTVSENSRKDIEEQLRIAPSKIVVARPATLGLFQPTPGQDDVSVLQRHDLSKGYFLYVGNLKETKNILFLLDVYQRLHFVGMDTPHLVLAGRNFIEGLETRISKMPTIRLLGDVSAADLPALYRGAHLFLFPSLYEGFGLPPLEAMACGTPVIASNRASLPEVIGDAGVLLDPFDHQAWLEVIKNIWTDNSLRLRLREKGIVQAKQFSWKQMAEKIVRVYEECL